MSTTFFACDDVHPSGDIAMRLSAPLSPRHAALLVLAGTNPPGSRPLQSAALQEVENPFALFKGAQASLEPQRSLLPGTPITALAGVFNCRF